MATATVRTFGSPISSAENRSVSVMVFLANISHILPNVFFRGSACGVQSGKRPNVFQNLKFQKMNFGQILSQSSTNFDTAETGLASLSFDVLLCDNANLN